MDNTTLEGGIMVTPALDTATGFVTTGDLYWLTSIGVSSSCSSILTEIVKWIIITNCEVFAVSMIPVAEQCLITSHRASHHCGHRTGAVISSDKHC